MQNSKSPSLAGGMFTSCPNCRKQFRVQASQLSIADGQVRCGVCDHEFSALSRLSDVPLTLEQMNYEFDYEPEENPVAEAELGEEPEFDIIERARPEDAYEKEVAAESAGDAGEANTQKLIRVRYQFLVDELLMDKTDSEKKMLRSPSNSEYESIPSP